MTAEASRCLLNERSTVARGQEYFFILTSSILSVLFLIYFRALSHRLQKVNEIFLLSRVQRRVFSAFKIDREDR